MRTLIGIGKWVFHGLYAMVLFIGIAPIGLGIFTSAHAVSLGAVTVKSKMGQPFEAVIPIAATKGDAQALLISLAKGDDYEKIGVEYEYYLRNIEAEMMVDKNLVPYAVRLFSRIPLYQPKVSLVMDATWPSGRFLRSYVMLVQPSDNIYAIAKSAGSVGMGGKSNSLSGEVPVFNEESPPSAATPLNDTYWAPTPRAPSRSVRPVIKKKTMTTKALPTSSMGLSTEQASQINEKKQELDEIKAQIQNLKEQINPK